MSDRLLKYSPEEFATKGSQIYQNAILPHLSADCSGKIVAIDIETGEFAIDDTTLTAAAKVFEHSPNAQLWFERVGSEGVHKFHSVRPAYL
jgi:hypothetical protein